MDLPDAKAITFTLTRQDVLVYMNYALWKVAINRRSMILRILYIPVALTVLFTVIGAGFEYSAVTILAMTAIWSVLLLWLMRRTTISTTLASPGAFGPQTVTLWPDMLGQRLESSESRRKWSIVQSVVATESQLLIFVTTRIAMVVPYRAFPSPVEARAFVETARAYWQAARAESHDAVTH